MAPAPSSVHPQSRWVLITGVSEGGMGDALTSEFLSRGSNVIATGRKISDLTYLPAYLEKLGINAISTSDEVSPNKHLAGARLERLELDVTSTSSIEAAVMETEQITGGRLDCLINNAGYGYMMPLLDAPIQDIKRNFDVNVFGLLEVTQKLFPLLRAAKGMVVNQSSIAGYPGLCQPFIGSYTASKDCVTSLGNTMRVEFWPFDVKVITLFTGDVKTEFWKSTAVHQIGIPPDSPYTAHKEHAEKMMRGETNPSRSRQKSREQWAKDVVDELLKTSPPAAIRRGTLTTMMWIVSLLVPTFLLDIMFIHVCKMKDFKKKLEVMEESKKRQ